MEMVDLVGTTTKTPAGRTTYDSPNCFNGYQTAGQMIYEHIPGFYVPVISTEGGPVVGWGDDNRYAKVNPTTQMEMQIGITRYMQSQGAGLVFRHVYLAVGLAASWAISTPPGSRCPGSRRSGTCSSLGWRASCPWFRRIKDHPVGGAA